MEPNRRLYFVLQQERFQNKLGDLSPVEFREKIAD